MAEGVVTCDPAKFDKMQHKNSPNRLQTVEPRRHDRRAISRTNISPRPPPRVGKITKRGLYFERVRPGKRAQLSITPPPLRRKRIRSCYSSRCWRRSYMGNVNGLCYTKTSLKGLSVPRLIIDRSVLKKLCARVHAYQLLSQKLANIIATHTF